MRWLWFAAGWLMVALGVGLFFVLGAAYVGTRPLPRQEREPGDAGSRIGR